MAEGGSKTVPLNKNKFKIGDVNDYKWLLTNFYETPIQIGHFSTDDKNEFLDNSRQMKFLSIPNYMSIQVKTAAGHRPMFKNVHLDLNEGFENYVDKYRDEETSFDKLLRWICSHKGDVEHRIHLQNSSKGASSSRNTSKGASSK